MSREVFVISDTHFLHKNISNFTGRVPDFEETIVENTNKLVAPDDLLIHLGDVSFNHKKSLDFVTRMNGRKVLVMGNHDQAKRTWYEENGWMFVCNSFTWSISGKYDGPYVLFSHAPVRDLPKGVMYCIHGHHHNGEHRRASFIESLNYPTDIWSYILVHCEDTLAPIRLNELLYQHKDRHLQEDIDVTLRELELRTNRDLEKTLGKEYPHALLPS